MGETLVIIALVFLGLWLLRIIFPTREKHLPDISSDHGFNTPERPYEAVSVHAYAGHCQAASLIAGQRFLSSEAPPLPLANCTVETCHCVYMHHYDRRSGSDRRLVQDDDEAFLSSTGHHNRRNSRGRRDSDLAYG